MSSLSLDYSQYTRVMENTLKTWAQSSMGATQVANTIKGLVLATSSVIVLVAAQFLHITLSATDIANLATNIGIVAGAIWTIFGLVMKLVMFFAKKPVVA